LTERVSIASRRRAISLLWIVLSVALAAGCDRSDSPAGAGEMHQENVAVTIIKGFGNQSTVIVDSTRGYGDGKYYDFSGFDSIRVNFVATRVSTLSGYDRIRVRVGVGYTFLDNLGVPFRMYSIPIRVTEIVKPASATLRFYVATRGAEIEFSDLSVFGWRRFSAD